MKKSLKMFEFISLEFKGYFKITQRINEEEILMNIIKQSCIVENTTYQHMWVATKMTVRIML